jgi:hypothetical protein
MVVKRLSAPVIGHNPAAFNLRAVVEPRHSLLNHKLRQLRAAVRTIPLEETAAGACHFAAEQNIAFPHMMPHEPVDIGGC